jgi:nicotinate-nucleotide adenylyltransferase
VIRALFGGSFDPIHAGHVALVDRVLADGLAQAVHVVPARRSPLRGAPCVAGPRIRLELASLAFAGRPEVILDDRELRRSGASYTVETLAGLAAEHPDDRWRLLVGADQAAAFARWRAPQRLLVLAELVVVARGPVPLPALVADRALVIEDFDHPASATAIRRELAAGRLPGPDRLPPAVAARIAAAGLYGFAAGRKEPT